VEAPSEEEGSPSEWVSSLALPAWVSAAQPAVWVGRFAVWSAVASWEASAAAQTGWFAAVLVEAFAKPSAALGV